MLCHQGRACKTIAIMSAVPGPPAAMPTCLKYHQLPRDTNPVDCTQLSPPNATVHQPTRPAARGGRKQRHTNPRPPNHTLGTPLNNRRNAHTVHARLTWEQHESPRPAPPRAARSNHHCIIAVWDAYACAYGYLPALQPDRALSLGCGPAQQVSTGRRSLPRRAPSQRPRPTSPRQCLCSCTQDMVQVPTSTDASSRRPVRCLPSIPPYHGHPRQTVLARRPGAAAPARLAVTTTLPPQPPPTQHG